MERKVCVLSTTHTPGVKPLQILFLLYFSSFYFFLLLPLFLGSFFSLGLLRVTDISSVTSERGQGCRDPCSGRDLPAALVLTCTAAGPAVVDGVLHKTRRQAKDIVFCL